MSKMPADRTESWRKIFDRHARPGSSVQPDRRTETNQTAEFLRSSLPSNLTERSDTGRTGRKKEQ